LQPGSGEGYGFRMSCASFRCAVVLLVGGGIAGCGSASLKPDGGVDAGGGRGGSAGRGGAIGRGAAGGAGGTSAIGGTNGGAGGAGIAGGAGGIAGGGVTGRGGSPGGNSGGGGASGIGGSAGAAGTGGNAGTAGAAGCNPACDATHVCTGGRCLLADAQQCVTAAQCASGACNPFYKDVDGDGFGTGQAVGFCTLATPPIGYAAQNGDCCDDATPVAVAKLIHPGADFQTTSAGGICGVTWDYDCSGKFEKNRVDCASCTQDPCACVNVDYADSACGTSDAGKGCSLAGAPTPTCRNFAGGVGPIACR
jgi:hypothetical protein